MLEREVAQKIVQAVKDLTVEHGAPNQFYPSEVADVSGLPVSQVYRAFRHGVKGVTAKKIDDRWTVVVSE